MNGDKFRYFNTRTWRDDWFVDLTKDERMLWCYLLTSPNTNLAGVYKLSFREIQFDTLLDARDIKRIFNDVFEPAGKAFYVDGYVVIKNWLKHQKFNNNHYLGVEKILKTIPEKLLCRLSDIDDPCYMAIDRLSIAYGMPIDGHGDYSNSNSNSNSNKHSYVKVPAEASTSPAKKKTKKYSESEANDIKMVYGTWCKLFNKNMVQFQLTDKRKAKIFTRVQDIGVEAILNAMKNIHNSPFHNGDNDRGWTVKLDWLLETFERTEEWAYKTDEDKRTGGTNRTAKEQASIDELMRKREQFGAKK
jgi:hypothetical protein